MPEIKFSKIPLRTGGNVRVLAANMANTDDRLKCPFPTLDNPGTITAAIIGGGPTLRETVGNGLTRLEELATATGLLKILAGTAHRLADEKTITDAQITIINSPAEDFADVIKTANPAMQYWLASFVSPKVLEIICDF